MRALLVTSRLTFVPHSQRALFEPLLAGAAEHLAGLLLLDNVTLLQLGAIPMLGLYGCTRLAGALTRNLRALSRRERERRCEQAGVPVHVARDINDPQLHSWLQQQRLDLIVNTRTDQIVRRAVRRVPRLGCLNVHHGLLPEDRGMMCDLFALAEGRPTGFTVHRMTARVDRGPILLRHPVEAPADRDYLSLVERSARAEGEQLAQLLRQIAQSGQLPPGRSQKGQTGTYHRLRGTPAEAWRFRRLGVRL